MKKRGIKLRKNEKAIRCANCDTFAIVHKSTNNCPVSDCDSPHIKEVAS
jgi:Zn finger protein HypA/HybF involved in hydrogenase expression